MYILVDIYMCTLHMYISLRTYTENKRIVTSKIRIKLERTEKYAIGPISIFSFHFHYHGESVPWAHKEQQNGKLQIHMYILYVF